MHLRRLAPALATLAAIALAVSACSSSSEAGWTFAPPPTPTAAPSVSPGASGAASAAPSTEASAAPSSAASAGPGGGTALSVVAQGVQYQTTTLEATAGQPFQIAFDNQDAGIPHNIQIADAGGTMVFEGDTINGVAQTTYNVPALTAGVYKFTCKWHPNMVGELTVK
jgi:plastocyanin